MYIPTYREITGRLLKEGWKLERQKGSHRQFFRDGKRVTVSGGSGKQPTSGEWKDIKKKAGW